MKKNSQIGVITNFTSVITTIVYFYRGIKALVVLSLNLSSLTNSVSEVVQLSSANLTVSDNLNLFNRRRVEREYSLNATAVCNTSNCESLVDAAVLLSDNCTLEYLDTELVAFLDLYANLYKVTDFDHGGICLHAALLNKF